MTESVELIVAASSVSHASPSFCGCLGAGVDVTLGRLLRFKNLAETLEIMLPRLEDVSEAVRMLLPESNTLVASSDFTDERVLLVKMDAESLSMEEVRQGIKARCTTIARGCGRIDQGDRDATYGQLGSPPARCAAFPHGYTGS
jgi:hypothetical protein